MSQRAVIIIERVDALRAGLARRLSGWPCEVICVADLFTGWRFASAASVRLVVVGQSGGDDTLLSQFARAVEALPAAPAILFLPNSAHPSSLSMLADAAAKHLNPANQALANSPAIVGDSALMKQVRSYLWKVGQTSCPVLIMGETGTGKELVARGIHDCGARAAKPFVAVNCAAVPDSLFESEMFGYERGAFTGAFAKRAGRFAEADSGTLFLDEIGELSPYAQAKLLRVLESKHVEPLGGQARSPIAFDVRFVTATNRSLEDLVKAGSFRRDLFYRLAVTRLELPALRHRIEDIPPLLCSFLEDVNRRLGRAIEGFDEETFSILLRHPWPGNVRELKNLVEAIAVEKLTGSVTPADIPAWFVPRTNQTDASDDERASLVAALGQTRWNKSRTARTLGWSRMKLYRKLAWHGLDESEPVPRREMRTCAEPLPGTPDRTMATRAGRG